MRKFADEQSTALRLAERLVVRLHPGHLQQLRHDPAVDLRVLAHVETGEVEAEDLDRADEVGQRTLAKHRPVLGDQRVEHGLQIPFQRGGSVIGFGVCARGAGRRLAGKRQTGRRQPPVDPRQRSAVGLAGAIR